MKTPQHFNWFAFRTNNNRLCHYDIQVEVFPGVSRCFQVFQSGMNSAPAEQVEEAAAAHLPRPLIPDEPLARHCSLSLSTGSEQSDS